MTFATALILEGSTCRMSSLRLAQHRGLPVIERLANKSWRHGLLLEHQPTREMVHMNASFR